jgi:ribonuclease HI
VSVSFHNHTWDGIKEYLKCVSVFWDCFQSLMELAERNMVQLVWVPLHTEVERNGIADHLAKTHYEHPFSGPVSACSI